MRERTPAQARAYILGLVEAQPEAAWREALDEVLARVDLTSPALDAVASLIAERGIWEVATKLKHGLTDGWLDPQLLGFDIESFDPTDRLIMSAAVCFEGGFDVSTLEDLLGLSGLAARVDTLRRASWLRVLDEDAGVLEMTWSARVLMAPEVPDLHHQHLRHAHYFVERAGDTRGPAPEEFVLSNLEKIAVWSLPHEPDLAARAALRVVLERRKTRPIDDLVSLLRQVIASRSMRPRDPLSVELQARLGELYRAGGRYDESIEALELALALEPPPESHLYGGVHMALAMALAYARRPERAMSMIRVSIEHYEAHGSTQQLLFALQSLATVHVMEERYAESAQLYEDILARHPGANSSVRTNLGAVYSALGDAERARAHLTKAAAQARQEHDWAGELITLNNLMTVELSAERLEHAQQCTERIEQLYALLETPEHEYSSLTHCNRALHAMKLGSLVEAYHAAQKGLSGPHVFEPAWSLNIAVLAILGRIEDAERVRDEWLSSLETHECSEHHMHRQAYTEFALRYGRIMDAKGPGAVELHRELKGYDRARLGCWMGAMFSDLKARLERLEAVEHVLFVSPDLTFARTGAVGEAIDLRRSTVLRALLGALTAHHLERPGEVCPTERLFEAAWPHHAWNLSARARLHTSIYRLRERVLGDLLVTHEQDGYSLASSCTIETLEM